MRGIRFRPRSVVKGANHTVAHLGCRLSGERDRHNRLGLIRPAQQREKALDQEFGLSRTRRSLHDKRLRMIERMPPLLLILNAFRHPCFPSRHPRAALSRHALPR